MATGPRAARGSRRSASAKPAKSAKPTKAKKVRKPAPVAAAKRRPAKATVAPKAAPARKKAAKKPAGAVMPYLTVRDAAASLAFYQQAFGFKRGETVSAPDGRLIRVVMHHAGAAAFKFSPEGVWSGSMQAPATSGQENPIVLSVPCRKVDALAARARAAGATIITEPEDMFWGERIARIADPDGYVWCFAATLGKFDPARMPVQVPAPAPAESAQPAPSAQSLEFDPWDTQAPAAEPQQNPGSDLDFEL